jgi:hypothetical protein
MADSLRWGAINNQMALSSQVHDMVISIKCEGLHHCEQKTAILISLHLDWLEEELSKSIDSLDLDKLLAITLMVDGEAALGKGGTKAYGSCH